MKLLLVVIATFTSAVFVLPTVSQAQIDQYSARARAQA